MPFNAPLILSTPYKILPVPRNLIPSPSTSPEQKTPQQHILWVGCSDSSVLETDCLDVDRAEMFVHRNLGHLLSNQEDLSSRSAVEWCVELLKVDHIIVCGHYDCSLISTHGNEAAKGWYRDVAKLHKENHDHLTEQCKSLDERAEHRNYEEVYVLAEVEWLKRQENVARAMKERGLQVHAFVFDKEVGGCVRLVAEREEKNERV